MKRKANARSGAGARQRVKAERRASEALFRGLLESAPDAMVIVDRDGRIALVNSQTEKLFGYNRDELIGQPVDMLLPVGLREAHVRHRTQYVGDPHTRPMGTGQELSGQRKDGSEFPVEISLSPLHTDDGLLVTAAVRDITERKRFEHALRDKNVELEKAIHAKDRFLASMSHELRTPLNPIIGYSGTLLMQLPGPLTEEQARQLSTIQSSANHLLSLINDLLDLAKIESGKVELSLRPIVCQSVVQEVAQALRPLAESKGLALHVDMPEAELVIPADQRALNRIIHTLVSHAIRLTEQGEVRIELQRRSQNGRILTEISVRDTGIGLRAEDQADIFEPFAIADAWTPGQSSGLGLHVSQKLAELLGGRISFHSEYGQGSTFTLIISE